MTDKSWFFIEKLYFSLKNDDWSLRDYCFQWEIMDSHWKHLCFHLKNQLFHCKDYFFHCQNRFSLNILSWQWKLMISHWQWRLLMEKSNCFNGASCFFMKNHMFSMNRSFFPVKIWNISPYFLNHNCLKKIAGSTFEAWSGNFDPYDKAMVIPMDFARDETFPGP